MHYSIMMLLSSTLLLTACGSGSDENTSDTDGNSQIPPTTDMQATGSSTETETETETEQPTAGAGNNPTGTGTADGSAQTASYRLTFNATWSAATHPDQFPPNPHFSGLIGAVHNEQVIFWERGQPATPGIELMAETGGKSAFRPELEAAQGSGYASAVIDADGVSTSPGTVNVEFEVSADFPEVTVVTMLAPSPDWFAGVHGLSLKDETGFVSQLTVDLALYDAGTDSGLNYIASNSDTQPRESITLLSSQSADSPFAGGLPIIGQFVFERL